MALKKRCFLIIIAFSLLITACKNNNRGDDKNMKENFSWVNPSTYSFESGHGLRDPFILKDGDMWYLTGTMYPYGLAKENSEHVKVPGVPLYKSSDLRNWEFVGLMVSSPTDKEKDKWYQDRFWAPEIFYHNGKYYLTVNCCELDGSDHGMLFAISDSIEGPYTVMNEKESTFHGNDAHLFVDDNGRTYLYGSDIWGVEIDLTNLKTLSNKYNPVLPIKGSTAWNGKRSKVGLEGPYVLKRNNVYYLFYSTWARGYEVGVATSDDPLKNYIMHEKPLYGSINTASCENYGGIFEEYYTNQAYYREVGHNSVFLGPDGYDWIVAHAYDYKNGEVKFVMDRLVFNDNKMIEILNVNTNEILIGPSYGNQELKNSEVKVAIPLKALDVRGHAEKGKKYVLPTQVDILFDNGWRECCAVIWNGNINTSEIGEQVISGVTTFKGKIYECSATIGISIE